jgi:hypothetical protein
VKWIWLLAAVGCDAGSGADLASTADAASADASHDASIAGDFASCPPSGDCIDQTCDTATEHCFCGFGTNSWFCNSLACPRDEPAQGSSCDPSYSGPPCSYGFENGCFCVTPEDVWVCCGGDVTCLVDPGLREGEPCCPRLNCPGVDRCGDPATCGCDDTRHWRCVSELDGGCDGG